MVDDFGLCIMILHCDRSLGSRAVVAISIVQFNMRLVNRLPPTSSRRNVVCGLVASHVHRFRLLGKNRQDN